MCDLGCGFDWSKWLSFCVVDSLVHIFQALSLDCRALASCMCLYLAYSQSSFACKVSFFDSLVLCYIASFFPKSHYIIQRLFYVKLCYVVFNTLYSV